MNGKYCGLRGMSRLAGLAVLLLGPASAWSGEISGTISFEKKAPVVGLIYLPGDEGLVGKDGPKLDQKDQRFTKPLVVGARGSKVTFKNSDTIAHNVYAEDTKAGANFDIGLAPPGSENETAIGWKEGMVVQVGCKIHPKMRAWVANISSRFHQVLEFEKGIKTYDFAFEAPGNLKEVRVWLPRYDPVVVELAVGEEKTVDLMKKGKKYGTLLVKRG